MKPILFYSLVLCASLVMISCQSPEPQDLYPEIPLRPPPGTMIVASDASSGPYLAATEIDHVHNPYD